MRPAPLKVFMSDKISGLFRGRQGIACCIVALALGACSMERKALFEEEAAPEWKELPLQLPAFPSRENLIPFQVSADASASFFVDEKSLSLGADGIVRYTLVVKAAGGAENLSYEGIRCATAERRLYALGRGTEWVMSRNDAWQRIVDNAFNRQHAVLAKDFFCPPGSVLPDREAIVRQLRNASRFR